MAFPKVTGSEGFVEELLDVTGLIDLVHMEARPIATGPNEFLYELFKTTNLIFFIEATKCSW